MNEEAILSVSDVWVRYGNMLALEGVSLSVPEGSVTALLGSNGAGKSTLLKVIAGVVGPEAGFVTYDGRRVDGESASSRCRRGISLVPEGRRIFAGLSVWENLKVGYVPRRGKGDLDECAEFVFGLFPDLAKRKSQDGSTLSGGQQQMLAIGRALMGKPRLLLLDEPSLGVSPKVVLEIYEVLRDLAELGTTVLLVEQYAALALATATYGYVLRNGQIALEGTTDELKADEGVQAAYLGL